MFEVARPKSSWSNSNERVRFSYLITLVFNIPQISDKTLFLSFIHRLDILVGYSLSGCPVSCPVDIYECIP